MKPNQNSPANKTSETNDSNVPNTCRAYGQFRGNPTTGQLGWIDGDLSLEALLRMPPISNSIEVQAENLFLRYKRTKLSPITSTVR